MYAPGVSVIEAMKDAIKRLVGYQLAFLIITVFLGAPAAIVIALTYPEAWPSFITAGVGFILTHTLFAFRDVEDSELESFTDYELRLTLTETLGLLALSAVYLTTVLLLAVGFDQAAAISVSDVYIWVALTVPLLDAVAVRGLGFSPGAVPVHVVLWALHLGGILTRIDPKTVTRYGQRGRSI